jgi:hypothetical protein
MVRAELISDSFIELFEDPADSISASCLQWAEEQEGDVA